MWYKSVEGGESEGLTCPFLRLEPELCKIRYMSVDMSWYPLATSVCLGKFCVTPTMPLKPIDGRMGILWTRSGSTSLNLVSSANHSSSKSMIVNDRQCSLSQANRYPVLSLPWRTSAFRIRKPLPTPYIPVNQVYDEQGNYIEDSPINGKSSG